MKLDLFVTWPLMEKPMRFDEREMLLSVFNLPQQKVRVEVWLAWMGNFDFPYFLQDVINIFRLKNGCSVRPA